MDERHHCKQVEAKGGENGGGGGGGLEEKKGEGAVWMGGRDDSRLRCARA